MVTSKRGTKGEWEWEWIRKKSMKCQRRGQMIELHVHPHPHMNEPEHNVESEIEVVVEVGENMDFSSNKPYHLRSAVQEDEIRIAVIDKKGSFHTIIIKDVRPALGHPKTEQCQG
jgi:hypothetical protein